MDQEKKEQVIEVKLGPGMSEIDDLPVLLQRCIMYRRGFPSCRHKPGNEAAGGGTAGIPQWKYAIGFFADRVS